jgi:hypothetical protein
VDVLISHVLHIMILGSCTRISRVALHNKVEFSVEPVLRSLPYSQDIQEST